MGQHHANAWWCLKAQFFMKTKNILLIFSWALYDLANQFFAINIISLYFSRWLVIEKGLQEIYYSLAFGISVFAVALLSPFFGFVSDFTQRPHFFLTLFTLISIFFTMLLGFTQNPGHALVSFAMANFGCQLAVIFYNALMVKIAPKNKIGLVSGLGRVVAYTGAIIALYLLNPKLLPYGYHAIFLGTAAAFLVFSLPCLIFLRDPVSIVPLSSVWKRENMSLTYRTLITSLSVTYQIPGMRPFLKAAFYGLIPVNVIILFMAVYAKMVFQLSEIQITHLIAIGTIFAIIGSFLSGYLSDLLGYRRCLMGVFGLWCLCFCLGSLSRQTFLYPLIGASSGFALGATFVIARAMAIAIIPKGKLGEAFGLFNLVGYMSSMTGVLFWGLLLLVLSPLGLVKYRIALFCLIPFMLAGFYYLLKIPEEKKHAS